MRIRIAAPAAAVVGCILLAQTAIAAPTAISLGTAAPFAILAGDAVTDVPTSVIAGDVGLTPATGAAMTGLTCAEVTGTIYTVDLAGPLCRDVNAGLLTTAKNALTAAYDAAAAAPPDTTYADTDNQLGTKTLTAGVYRFTAATTANLTGNLTLSGSADDVWIFQATSTLVTAARSSITFTGGAQACHVFWQVGSAATLGANSQFAGTILAHDDISLGSSVTVDGRLLAGGQANHAGAVTLISDTITRSDCATAGPSASESSAASASGSSAAGASDSGAAPSGPTSAPTTRVRGTAAANATPPNTSTVSAVPESPSGALAYVLLVIGIAVSAAIVLRSQPAKA
jgi:Ice-binding-like